MGKRQLEFKVINLSLELKRNVTYTYHIKLGFHLHHQLEVYILLWEHSYTWGTSKPMDCWSDLVPECVQIHGQQQGTS